MEKQKEIYGIIYVIRNKVNNKLYIGQTTDKNGFNGRYNYNILKRTHNEQLRRSIEKYGIESFNIDEEFDIAYSKEELDKLEDMYIKIYNTIDKNCGYNNKYGGANGKYSEETKQKMSEAMRGDKNPFYKKHHSEEQKAKWRKTRKGKLTGGENPYSRKVICITTGEIFDSIQEASDKYGIWHQNISKCCRGKLKSSGKLKDGTKLVWAYYQEEFGHAE